MDNFVILSARKVKRAELRSFIESWGGLWNEEPTLDQGVIERGPAAI